MNIEEKVELVKQYIAEVPLTNLSTLCSHKAHFNYFINQGYLDPQVEELGIYLLVHIERELKRRENYWLN